ncbi:MAG TPA: dihydrodipicolinate synthase family protein, partial [Acidobacteriaceae bacterium]|nr:dihydrodipicolinate synthase family protein [Acidobacteriaceae bacterium]
MTTALDEHYKVDAAFMRRHANWLLDNGCTGIISLGSLGQGATLTFAEKEAILRNMADTVGKRGPVVAAISALSTDEAVALAKSAEQAGCAGLMVLPPYVYMGDWREMKDHVEQVMRATPLPCMLYNNPISYGTDFLPSQMAELAAEHKNFEAVKESSSDVRRVSAIRA